MLTMTEDTETADSTPYFKEFRCLNCNWYLGAVVEHDGRTVLKFLLPGGKVLAFKAEIECSGCHEIREFHSSPMSAVRLKKWMEGDK